MRWYNPIAPDDTIETAFVASIADLRGVEDWKLREGEPIASWCSDAFFKAARPQDDGEADDVLQECLGVPVYSQRLQSALTRAGISDIQYLPVHVFRSDGTEIPGFSIANIVKKVHALDFEHSTYMLHGADYFIAERRGAVSVLGRPVLLKQCLVTLDVIRLAEFTPAVFVSERFKRAFEQGGFTGYSFEEVPLV